MSALHGLFLALAPAAQNVSEVTLERLEERPAPRAEAHPSFQESLRNLAFDALPELAPGSAAELVVRGLREIDAGRPEAAVEPLGLAEDLGEPGFTELARGLLLHIHIDAERYDLAFPAPEESDALARGLRLLPEPAHEFLAETELRAMRLGRAGMPEVEVEIGGERQWWMLDTGSALSIVPDSELEALGVRLLDTPPLAIETSTSQGLPVRVGVIEELRIGRLVIRDHAVFVASDEGLTFELPGGTYRLPGAVGGNAIRRGRVVLDAAGCRYSLEPSRGTPDEGAPSASLLWMASPLVRALDREGHPLLFFLDTGASSTDVSSELLGRRPDWATRAERVTSMGFAGVEGRDGRVLSELTLVFGDVVARITEVADDTEGREVFFLARGGTLGFDVARRARMVIDARAGVFELSLPEGIERDSWPIPPAIRAR